MMGESGQESYAQDGRGVLESGGLLVNTRPTFNMRKTRNMYVWGEYTYGNRY